jgi:hypothetical protein
VPGHSPACGTSALSERLARDTVHRVRSDAQLHSSDAMMLLSPRQEQIAIEAKKILALLPSLS